MITIPAKRIKGMDGHWVAILNKELHANIGINMELAAYAR